MSLYLVASLTGCIHIEGDPRLLDCAFSDDKDCMKKIGGPSERNSINDPELQKKLRDRSDKITAELEEKYPLVSRPNPLYERLDSMRREIAVLLEDYESPAYENAVNANSFFSAGDASRKELLQTVKTPAVHAVQSVDLRIIRTDAPVAYTFPNDRIYIATGLVDRESMFAAQSEDALFGVLAHEFIHLYEQHVVEHWAVLESSGYQTAKQALAVLTYFSPIQINITRPAPDAHRLAERIEFLADSGAVRLMKKAQRDPQPFLNYLGVLAQVSKVTGGQETAVAALEGRQACLKQCMKPMNATFRAFKTDLVKEHERTSTNEYGSVSTSYTITPRPTNEPDDKLTLLEPKLQYYICVKASMELDGNTDSAVLRNWLQNPQGKPLNEVSPQLTERGRLFVDDMRHVLSGHRLELDNFSITRDIYREAMQGWFGGMANLSGDRLNILDGCSEDMRI